MKKFDERFFTQLAEEAAQKFDTPAISAAVIDHGEIIFERGFGTRTLGAREAVDEHTSYAIASMSKSMTAACLAMLAEEGSLRWDAHVTDYLPWFSMYDDFTTREMRVRDLLLHNSGLNSESAGTLWYGSDYSREEVIRRLRYLRPVSGFRSSFAYQNVCYLAAGLVLEAVSGVSWDQFVAERLFRPLDMRRSYPTLAQRNAAGIDNIATPHAMIDGKLTAIPYRDHDNCGPAASVLSTAHDLAHYLQMFLGKGTLAGARVLSPESVRTLQTAYVLNPGFESAQADQPRLRPNFPGYGYGWRIQDYCGYQEVAHSGGVDGNRGRMAYFPEQDFGVAVLTNGEDRRTYLSLLLTVYDMMLGVERLNWPKILENANDVPLPPAKPRRIPGTHPVLDAERIQGAYCDSAYGDILVSEKAGTLQLAFSHTPAFRAELEHYHFETWLLKWQDPYIPQGLVTFIPGADGKARGLHLDQPRLLDVDFTELDDLIKKVED